MEGVTKGYDIDPHSTTARAIRDWIKDRIKMRRYNLELSGLPIDDTENQRGAIDELKELRSLLEPQAAPVEVPPSDTAVVGG